MKEQLFRFANKLYEHCYPVYHPMYAGWKALSDRRERALVKRLVRPGMTIVDVGANIGTYTRFLAKLAGEHGHVHAFEPSPQNFKRLHDNVGSSGNVSANRAAVGARNGTVKLYVSDELNVDHRTFDSADGRSSIDVPMIALDEYFSPGQRVDFIKIDVQGYELSVLQGARRVLEENRGIKLLMEFWPYGLAKANVDPAELIGMLRSSGFEISETTEPGGVFNAAELDHNNIGHYCNLLIARPLGASV